MLSAGVLLALLKREDEWGWRIAYATQWAWPILIIPGVLLAPEVNLTGLSIFLNQYCADFLFIY